MKLRNWELVGMNFVVGLAILLYFLVDLSNGSQYVRMFAPVNDSVWELLKMPFFGMVIFAFIEYIFVHDECKNFVFAKVFSAAATAFLTVVLFVGYREFMSESLIMNIVILVLAIMIGQLLSYGITNSDVYLSGLNYLAIIALLAAVIVFASHTGNSYPGSASVLGEQVILSSDE